MIPERNTIVCGDALEVMRGQPEGFVHCCVTSPPYWALRDYQVGGQIGLEKTPEEYIERMVAVFREVRRVLHESGTLWVVIGDCYNGSGKAGNNPEYRVRHKEFGKPSMHKERFGKPTNVQSLKPKDLCGIPWRLALALQADGWYWRSTLPWVKRNPKPESTKDRPTSAVEYVLMFSKQARYFFDMEAVRIHTQRSVSPREYQQALQDTGEAWYPRLGGNKGDDSKTKHGKKHHGIAPPAGRAWRNSDLFFQSWQGLWCEDNEPLAFVVNPEPLSLPHYAAFPRKLIEPIVKAATSDRGCCPICKEPWKRFVKRCEAKYDASAGIGWVDVTEVARADKLPGNDVYFESGWQANCPCQPAPDFVGDKKAVTQFDTSPEPCVVLDPFMGSGTTALVARKLRRDFLGIELNLEYVRMAERRLDAERELFDGKG